MKIVIIVFSPSGHTLKAAEMIKKCCQEKKATVKLIDTTRQHTLLFDRQKKENLKQQLGAYDLLFIGGPIYAGHMEKNILNTIRNLPRPDKQHANLAVPFATYGGAHSFIALEEMGILLKKKKYKSILGIKIAAEHTLTKTLARVICPDKPGKAEEKVIRQAIEHVFSVYKNKKNRVIDQSRSFKYSPLKWRILLRIFTQEKIYKNFKRVAINYEKCIKCEKCISLCPVNMFSKKNDQILMDPDKSRCILCAECFHSCPVKAIDYPYIEMARKRLQDGNITLEKDLSAIYPKI